MKRKLRNKLAILIAVLMTAMMFAGCGNKADETKQSQTVKETEAVKETETSKETKEETSGQTEAKKTGNNQYTDAFSIEYLDDGIKKVIDGEGRELILVPKEIDVPEEYADANVVRTPIENVLFMSSTQVCMLRPLDSESVWDSVAGVNGVRDSWSFEEIKKGFDDGRIVNVGGDMGEPDYELVQKINPDLAFVYTGSSPQAGVIEKFEELGIPYAVDNEYMEQTYMGRMEWLRFIAAFYNEDDKVDEIMANAKTALDEMKATVAGKDKPTVVYGNLYDGTVYVASKDSWVANMIADAGGEYLFSDIDVTGTQLSPEEFYAKAKDADIMIYSSTPEYTPDIASIVEQAPVLADCKPITEGNVWQLGSSFWTGIDESDKMAVDLAAAFYPDLFPDRETTYFVKMK